MFGTFCFQVLGVYMRHARRRNISAASYQVVALAREKDHYDTPDLSLGRNIVSDFAPAPVSLSRYLYPVSCGEALQLYAPLPF
jgi:hypothetical protein